MGNKLCSCETCFNNVDDISLANHRKPEENSFKTSSLDYQSSNQAQSASYTRNLTIKTNQASKELTMKEVTVDLPNVFNKIQERSPEQSRAANNQRNNEKSKSVEKSKTPDKSKKETEPRQFDKQEKFKAMNEPNLFDRYEKSKKVIEPKQSEQAERYEKSRSLNEPRQNDKLQKEKPVVKTERIDSKGNTINNVNNINNNTNQKRQPNVSKDKKMSAIFVPQDFQKFNKGQNKGNNPFTRNQSSDLANNLLEQAKKSEEEKKKKQSSDKNNNNNNHNNSKDNRQTTNGIIALGDFDSFAGIETPTINLGNDAINKENEIVTKNNKKHNEDKEKNENTSPPTSDKDFSTSKGKERKGQITDDDIIQGILGGKLSEDEEDNLSFE